MRQRAGAGTRNRAARSRLRLVAPSAVLAGRVPFAAVCAGIIVVTLVGVLLINIALSRGAYSAADLRRESLLLAEQEQELRERLAAAEAPGQVQARASALGMVSARPLPISLGDAAVVAVPTPVLPTPVLPAPPEPPGGTP